MSAIMKVLLGVFAVVGALGAVFILCLFGYGMSSFFAPRYAEIDSKVFHESAQYNDGMVRDLENLEREYNSVKTREERDALKSTILHRFSVYPQNKLSPGLKQFYNRVLVE